MKKTAEEILDENVSFRDKVKKEFVLRAMERYALECCEDLRERIATISISLIGFEGELFEKEIQDKIRNVEIITP